ncbi:MAG: hypothetical protein ACOYON_14295 [Fimbriimonas sp.]
MGALRKYWPVLILVLVPLIALWRTLLGEAIGPFADIATMVPGGPKGPDTGWDILQADGILQFYVWRDIVLDAWRHGQVPLWNPYQLAGVPILANSQSGALYPPHVLLGVLGVPTPVAVTLLAWFHLAMAGLGVHALVRRLGGEEVGGVVAGTSFALSTFMLSWTGLASVISTVCWIPWALAAVVLILGSDRRSGFVVLSLSVAMMLLAGHLQFSAYGLFAVLFWIVWTATQQKAWGRIHLSILALAIGVGLAAPQVVSVLNYSQYSHRRNTPTEEGYQAYANSSLQVETLATLAFPSLDGNPREAIPNAQGLSLFAPKLIQPGANLAEQAIGIGPIVFCLIALAFVQLRRQHPAWGLGILGALALWVALGSPLSRLAYFAIPGWSSTGSPGRIIVLFLLGAFTLGGVTLSSLLAQSAEDRRPEVQTRALLGALVAMLLTLAFSQTLKPGEGVDPRTFEAVRGAGLSAALPAAIIGALLAVGVLAWLLKEQSLRSKAAVLALVPVLAVLVGATTLIPTGTPNLKLPFVPKGRIANQPGHWDLHFRARTTLPPNLATLFRVEELGGYDSLLHRDTVAMMNELNGQDSAPPINGNMMFVKVFDYAKLADAGVTEVWNPTPAVGYAPMGGQVGTPPVRKIGEELLGEREWEPGIDSPPLARAVLKGPGIADVEGKPAEIIAKDWQGVTVRATGPGKLTVRYRNLDGWNAKINGQHAVIIGTRWVELNLPASESTVRLTYVAPGFRTGIPIALASILSFAILVFALTRKNRQASASASEIK